MHSRRSQEIMVSVCVGSAISPNPRCNDQAPVWWDDATGEGGTIAFPRLVMCKNWEMCEDRGTLNAYCISMTPEQRAALHTHNISSVYDLLSAAREEEAKSARPDVSSPTIYGAVYKRSVLFFLNKKCKKLSVDFNKLYKSCIVERGGQYPAQWLRPKQNCGMSENDAFLAALLKSAGCDEAEGCE